MVVCTVTFCVGRWFMHAYALCSLSVPDTAPFAFQSYTLHVKIHRRDSFCYPLSVLYPTLLRAWMHRQRRHPEWLSICQSRKIR